MNKEFIEKIENKVNSINILDKDTFVEESCKNLYRALLVVAENENPPISDILNTLNDTNKTIELLKKFDDINKEKYNGDLSYIVIDVDNNQTLLYLIELLKQSINQNDESYSIDNNEEKINIDDINIILNSILTTSTFLNIKKIKDIKFLPSKQGHTIEVSDGYRKLYMGISEYGYVEIVRENSIDGKIVYMPDDDIIINDEVDSNKKEICYDFIPYKQIGTIRLDKTNTKDFQPNSVPPFFREDVSNHVICRAIAIDYPEHLERQKRLNKDVGQVYIICDGKKIELTSMFKKFVSNFNQICDDMVIIENVDDWNFVSYSKKLGIIAWSNVQFEDNYYIFAIEFAGKEQFDKKIDEIYNIKNSSTSQATNKGIYTLEQKPWIEYLEIDEETGERKLRSDTPEEIVKKYNQFVGNVKNNDNELNNNSPMSKIKNFFHIDSKNNNDVTKFAQEHGYKGAKYIGNWKEYKVYEPYVSGNDVSFIGLPLVILVNNNGETRMSTSDEAMAILDDKSFIESSEENKNINETKLIRENLINLINNFKDERNKYDNTNIPNDLYLDYLEKIESILNSYNDDIDDNRFVNKNIINNGWISNDDAIDYLFDNIIGNIPILPTDVPQGQNLSNISAELNQYYKDGYVCSKEKEMLLNIINEIKKYINTSKYDSFIRKYKIDENGNEYEEFKNISISKFDNLSPDQANNLINNIDSKIAELQIEKEKIDKEIAENLEEVSKYSILNKTLDELLNAKKKFINDWYKLLFNTSDEHWIMNSATYRVHLVSVINAILRREQDNKSTEQLELLNKITEFFGNQDRDSVIKIVKQLKEIESE